MAIKPPNYKKDAIPTPRGWTHPRTGELLHGVKISQEAIDEYLGNDATMLTESPVTIEEFKTEHLTPLPEEDEFWTEDDLNDMSKIELEELGREYGIELDRRSSKAVLIEELSAVMFED